MSKDKDGTSAAKAAASVAAGAAAAVAGTKLAQKVVGQAGKALGADPEQPNRATQTLTIGASTEELFRFYREPTNFQRVLRNLAEVRSQGDGDVHWKMPGPGGHALEWDARLSEERRGERLRWTPAPGSGTSAELEVRLHPAPDDRCTAVTMRLEVEPSSGAAAPAMGAAAGALVVKALYGSKALIETGEVPTLEKNPSARPGEGDRV
jgi:uncharacterized membrane protein